MLRNDKGAGAELSDSTPAAPYSCLNKPHSREEPKMSHARAALLMAVTVLVLTSCGGTSPPGSASPSASPTPYELPVYTYEVEGVASNATVTMATPNGQEQHSIEELSTEVTSEQRWSWKGSMPFLYVSIQGGSEYTDVTCRILMDGKVLSQNTSDAAYGIATCQVA